MTARALLGLVLRSMIDAPANGATFAHVANAMPQRVVDDGKPAQYRAIIEEQFRVREVPIGGSEARCESSFSR